MQPYVLFIFHEFPPKNDIINSISDGDYYDLFKRVADLGMGVELNTPLNDSYVEELLRPYRIAKACKCKFYLGSDAHTPDELINARPCFEALIDSLSLTEDDKFNFQKNI